MLAIFLSLSLANERITFDDKCAPHFTESQIKVSAPSVREGLAEWTSTARGCETIRRFDTREYDITVVENALEDSTGQAPPPGIATLAAAADHTKQKRYDLILNPSFKRTTETLVFHDEPNTPAQLMAAAWAAEMLHIDFYSRGISLPHHSRADFQREWRELARQLGFPRLEHDDGDSPRSSPSRRVIFWR